MNALSHNDRRLVFRYALRRSQSVCGLLDLLLSCAPDVFELDEMIRHKQHAMELVRFLQFCSVDDLPNPDQMELVY